MAKIKPIIVRHDDFDFRLSPQEYINIHEEFKKAGLIETAVMQWTQWGKLAVIHKELIEYMKKELKDGTYDIQLHGWGHFHYDEFEYDFIVRDLLASQEMSRKYFGVVPTIWYPPWNCMSNNMERAAEKVGMTISNESNDIWKFIREVEVELVRNGSWSGHSIYFHGWKADEMKLFHKMLKLLKRQDEYTKI